MLWAIRNELARRGLAVLAFNFRGTMRSGGSHGGGRAEVRDVRAAVGRVREEAAGPTLVAGWSFGANVALRAAPEDPRVGALALVGLPLGEHGLEVPDLPSRAELAAFDRPVLLVAGEGDQVSPAPELRDLAAKLRRAEVAIVRGTGHFFWRREAELAGLVGDFAERALFGPAP